jgi:hypothetical protein
MPEEKAWKRPPGAGSSAGPSQAAAGGAAPEEQPQASEKTKQQTDAGAEAAEGRQNKMATKKITKNIYTTKTINAVFWYHARSPLPSSLLIVSLSFRPRCHLCATRVGQTRLNAIIHVI